MVSLYVDTFMTPSSPPTHLITPYFFISFRCLTPLPLTSWVSWPLGLSRQARSPRRCDSPPALPPAKVKFFLLGTTVLCPPEELSFPHPQGVGLTLTPALGCDTRGPERKVGAPGLHLGQQGAGLAPGTASFCPGRWKPHPKRAQPQLLGSEAISSPLSALLLKKTF